MKKGIFWVITIAFPFLILLLVELGLRIGGYNEAGRDLFVKLPAKSAYVATNPAFIARYFPSFLPQVAVAPFLEKKPDNTFRVFVLGGSSAEGFPYNFYNSFSARIEQKLLMETQGLNIEVINLGMTAVNSYVIWDMRKRIMEYQPDAIVIYAGHNEYYGSFGVGSTQFGTGESIFVKRLTLRLKNLALYQLLESLIKPDKKSDTSTRTMMAKVVKESEISLGSDLYEAGIEQFESNISEVVGYFSEHSVPVLIGTVASNLKDQQPMGEEEEALEAYYKGQELLKTGNTDSALQEFTRAKELDGIRFRAPEEINAAIRDIADKYDVVLVDVNQASIDSSDSHIPDNSFFVDHLHPSWISNQLIGELFFDKLRGIPSVSQHYSPNKLSERTKISQFDKTYSEVPIIRLESGYPFKKGISEAEEYANFQREYDRYLARSYVDSIAASTWRLQRQPALALTDVINYLSKRKDTLSVTQHYISLAYWQIFNDDLLKKGVNYSINSRELDMYSARLLHIILSKQRWDPYFSNALSALYLIHEDLNRAEYWLKYSEKLDPNSIELLYNYARFYALKNDTTTAKKYFQKYINSRNSN